MGNLFSSFDPQARILFFKGGYNWISAIVVLFLIPRVYWIIDSQFSKSVKIVLIRVYIELKAVFGEIAIAGTLLIFLVSFFFILASNFIGLFPYVFTASSHLVFTLALSIPLWLGSIIWSLLFQFSRIMAHLVPLGTPPILIPVIVIIETVRSIIRPFTLAVRLAANIIAGHLLLTLLGRQGGYNINIQILLVIISLILLLILECAVACIQSYVFTILRSLYLNELIRIEFSKKFLF